MGKGGIGLDYAKDGCYERKGGSFWVWMDWPGSRIDRCSLTIRKAEAGTVCVFRSGAKDFRLRRASPLSVFLSMHQQCALSEDVER